MNLLLNRESQTADATLGRFFAGNECLYYTCEDLQRAEKIPGKTAIPCGRYKVVITFSNRFQKFLPLLLDVPGFTGVRIHSGNTAADTEGCILIGKVKTANGIGQSRAAMADFMPRLAEWLKAGEVWLEVKSVI